MDMEQSHSYKDHTECKPKECYHFHHYFHMGGSHGNPDDPLFFGFPFFHPFFFFGFPFFFHRRFF